MTVVAAAASPAQLVMARETALEGEFSPAPVIRYTVADQVKKGEDFHLIDVNCSHGSHVFGVYGVFDGHNGVAAAVYCRDKLMVYVKEHLPKDGDEAAFLDALPLALAEGFLKCHNTFVTKGVTSGTTATVVIVTGWTLTVAGVGDSRAILDTIGGGVTTLSIDHRFEDSLEEQKRVLKEGGQLSKLRTFEGVELGPLRSWPGGLCVSRSIGDVDCGPFITPLPHVKQIRIPPGTGGRVIMASDGLWDAVDSDKAAKCCRGMPHTTAAPQLVKESIRMKGLRDDITVLLVDLLPPQLSAGDKNACPVPKGASVARNFLFKLKKKKAAEEDKSEVQMPQLMNEQDSMRGGALYERYKNASLHAEGNFCAVCGSQVDHKASEVSVRAGNLYCSKHRPSAKELSAKA